MSQLVADDKFYRIQVVIKGFIQNIGIDHYVVGTEEARSKGVQDAAVLHDVYIRYVGQF